MTKAASGAIPARRGPSFCGPYFSDNFFAIKEPQEGVWNFMFTETWDGGTEYNNVRVDIIKVPAPGALALLGVAGLAGCRRRRRS